MKSYFKIAWRNIWRVKNRTFITASAIALAIFFAVIMRGFQLGSYDLMMENAVEKYIGHIQIHKKGYTEDPTINMVFEESEKIKTIISNHKNVAHTISQITGGAMVSFELQTNGALILGIDPIAEKQRLNLENKLVEGKYISPGDNEVVLGENLAKFLKVGVGDSISLASRNYFKLPAFGKFAIKGIVHMPAPDLNSSLVIMDKKTAQTFFSAKNMVSEYCINLNSSSETQETIDDLKAALGSKFEVLAWYETRPDLKQQIDSDNASGILFLGLLYLVIGFGVFGTIMMMTMERRKEFGITLAVGMKKWKLVRIITIETLIIGIMGIIAGIMLAVPVNVYFHLNPIELPGSIKEAMESFGVEAKMPFALELSFYINQIVAVVVIVLIAAIYPVISILRMKIIKAIRN
ncbi:MAG: ABC transporter permease [Bacteroidales bacterium]|nr:ABC transporter permease [Bacteroidales bacterium]